MTAVFCFASNGRSSGVVQKEEPSPMDTEDDESKSAANAAAGTTPSTHETPTKHSDSEGESFLELRLCKHQLLQLGTNKTKRLRLKLGLGLELALELESEVPFVTILGRFVLISRAGKKKSTTKKDKEAAGKLLQV